jgi:hypothetical protein
MVPIVKVPQIKYMIIIRIVSTLYPFYIVINKMILLYCENNMVLENNYRTHGVKKCVTSLQIPIINLFNMERFITQSVLMLMVI